MISHLSLGVRDMELARRFYDAVLGALGYGRLWTTDTAVGYGVEGGSEPLALFAMPDGTVAPGLGFHLAFVATSQEAVNAFHAAALSNGGTDAGEPGPRPRYGPTYYAAFVTDPDGHKLEAVHQ